MYECGLVLDRNLVALILQEQPHWHLPFNLDEEVERSQLLLSSIALHKILLHMILTAKL